MPWTSSSKSSTPRRRKEMVAMTSSGTAVVTLPKETQILITREFDARKEQIYRAWTTPELIKRWWHAKRGKVTRADVDLRVGGSWRWVMVTDDGFEVAFHGEYREIVPNERLVYTEVYEGVPGGDDAPVVITMTLEEKSGRTTMTQLSEAPNQQVRDAIIESGMEPGMQDAMDLLEQVAAGLN
jgi:uncharacterized protein YndB with AHSA1/START domain